MPTADEIRSLFLREFVAWGHTEVPSSRLVPEGDPTLLFTNAGMVQFKPLFLGEQTRAWRRAVSAQKCMRAGGKHNDLDNVGRTARHHTFFEMLGNFSFGDYFKAEAIQMAWSLMTARLCLPIDRLFATVYKDDDEAESLWRRYLPGDRIIRLGDADNFWQMGETGPCGPCSEILIDQGAALHADCPGIGRCDCDRYLEIWNLVFMQYNRSADGSLAPLPAPSIDTGMGLERLTAVCNGVASNYDTDLFTPIFSAIAAAANQTDAAVRASVPGRVIADHLRAITFLIADGVTPANEGRGYVLRRILRRAARFGRKLGLNDPFLHLLTGAVVETMEGAYPALSEQQRQISQVALHEETRFIQTLRQGIVHLDETMASARRQGESVLSGEAVFTLYDTYGFPVDLAEEVAKEEGFSVDLAGFDAAMSDQKARARRSWVGAAAASEQALYVDLRRTFGPTRFTGYERLEDEATLLALLKAGRPVESAGVGEEVELLFDRTPFYGEAGGQVGDRGEWFFGDAAAAICDTTKPLSDLHLHRAKVTRGTLVAGVAGRGRLVVDAAARRNTARNHTATHLLHALLQDVLGDHVRQAGSLVTPDRLRFDFRHFAPASDGALDEIEARLNAQVHAGMAVATAVMGIDEAVATGAMALFGEKYGDEVRVVQIADVSRELCGGTHCRDTAEIGLFKIVREGGVAAGIRRIEAVTGPGGYQWLKQQEAHLREAADRLKSAPADMVRKIDRLLADAKEAERRMEALQTTSAAQSSDIQKIGALAVAAQLLPPLSIKALRMAADRLRDRVGSGAVVVGAASPDGSSASLVAMVTPDWTSRLSAVEVVKEAARLINGTGGGSEAMAQAGGKNAEGLNAALAQAVATIKRRVPQG